MKPPNNAHWNEPVLSLEGEEVLAIQKYSYFRDSSSCHSAFPSSDVPMAVTEGTATVDDEFVTVSWMHSQQQEAIPVSSFTVVGGRINPPTSTINLRVVSGVFQVTLDRDTLDPGADYRVTVRAVNLLGGSDERDVTFRIPRGMLAELV